MTIRQLPTDVISNIGAFLNFCDQSRMCRLNKHWREGGEQCYQNLFERMIAAAFQHPSPGAAIREIRSIVRSIWPPSSECVEERRLVEMLRVPHPHLCASLCRKLLASIQKPYPFCSPLLIRTLNGSNLLKTAEKWLQQAHEDHALMRLWKIIRIGVDGPDFTELTTVRNWMNDPANTTSRLTRVTTPSLSNRDLRVIPKEFGLFTQLRVLVLKSNCIEVIPPEIKHCIHLRELSLSYNRIQVIPPEIEYLTQLITVDLTHNQLKEFPLQLKFLSNLQSLSLSENELRETPPEIEELKQLRSLSLGDNLITIIPAAVMPLLSRRCSALHFLNNPILMLPEQLLSNADYADQPEIVSFNRARAYSGTSPMARLCLAIMHRKQEEISRLLQNLPQEERDPIADRVWELAGYPADGPQQAERYALENLSHLARAVASTIIEKIDTLPWSQHYAVCAHAGTLIDGKAPLQAGLFRGVKQHVTKAYLPMLADALAVVTQRQS